MTRLVTWLLATCAPIFDVEVHAATVMSSHYHIVLSVANQQISGFFELFNGQFAKAINVLRRARRGIVWEPGELSIVELKTRDAVVFELAYAIVNPVAAGLVWSPEDWPGLSIQVEDMGRRVLEEARPDGYFDAQRWAESASLEVTLPACLLELGEDAGRRLVASEVKRQLARARADIKAKYGKVLGPVAAQSVSPFKRAKTWETFGTLHPTFATGPGRRAERKEAAEELVAYREDYRAAWKRYQAGEHDVVFPYGTYLMRVRHHVRVAPAPS